MAKSVYPTAEFVRQLLNYDPATGMFKWKKRSLDLFSNGKQTAQHNCSIWNGKFAGKKAGCISKDGYLKIRINNKLYLGHKLAWLYVYGDVAQSDIDHINMIISDNRIANLRLASRSQNMANTRAHKDNLSGVKGVYFDKRRMKYIARITVNGSSIQLGSFSEIEKAKFAYKEASIKYFGEYQRDE